MANTPSKIAQGYDERLTDRPIPYLMRWLYPRADQIIAVSRGLADDLVQNYGVDRQRVKVIYNPTVTDTLIERAKGSADHPWFQDAGTEIVLGVGSLTVQKDFSTLLRAFKLVCQRRNTKLVILGEGSQRTQLEELAGRLGIEDDISLPGTVTNPYPYMAQADVFALSSRWEGCPNVLIEALACGCPVVATDCPHGPKEILEDGRYGPLVPVGDHRELAEKIRKILDTPLKKSVLRDRAMDFHVETIADEYEELLYRD